MSVHSPYAQWLGTSVGSYRLEQLLEQGTQGLVFLGHESASASPVRIRVLAVPAAQNNDVATAYRQALEREMAPIASLRHPYILPLMDYGIHQGLPYLVWPHLVMRPFSARLSQSGPMDIVNAGRYLDQIATALESAHALGILHLNLSTDCVFMQLDGQPIIADFGVRRLLEAIGADERSRPFYGSLEACAPEQLMAGAIGPYTDVYALGALTYRLLTGQPVFAADSVDALLQQHLYASVPSVRMRRAGLPGALDRVLDTALAKEPAARFGSPGAFADAYHEVVSPGRGTRMSFGSHAPVSRVNSQRRASNGAAAGFRSSASFPHDGEPNAVAPAPARNRTLTGPPPVAPALDSPRGRLATLTSRRSSLIATALLILLFISGGLFIVGGGHLFSSGGGRPSGQVEFDDSPGGPPGNSDALRLSAKGLPALPSGSHYAAWILNQQTERVVPLGALTDTDQAYSLTYNGDGGSGQPGTNLLGIGDRVEITVERGDAKAPVGSVVLVGVFPPKASVHIQHLLVSFPTTPGKIGLLVGTLEQARLLNAQAALLQNAQTNRNLIAVQCSAQSIIDIIEGSHGSNYRSPSPSCQAQNLAQVGDGYGLVGPPPNESDPGSASSAAGGYLADASDHASLAATQPDATASIRTHASHVEVAIANIKGWVTTADQDALKLLKTPSDTAAASELATLCDHAYHGVPGTIDQQINPVPGQAGAITAYEHGQFMATVTLAPGS
jgi:serine/threonine protein kinase